MIIIIFLLVCYLVYEQLQMTKIEKQLKMRKEENVKQRIYLSLISPKLNHLVATINDCLQTEENLRLLGFQEEKRFRELIANISHDLRTPLTAVKGYQQLLADTDLDQNQREKLSIAMKHTNELGTLIEHFFEYSYLVNAEPKIYLEKLNVTNLVVECIVASVTSLEEAGVSVNIVENKQVSIVSDKEMVTRIVQNLIRNCVQHAKGEVTVKVAEEKEKAEISFSNMVEKPENLNPDLLFERFYSGGKARSKSTGIGLAIVKLLTEYLGGEVQAELEGVRLTIKVII